jgi:hypothetical protein
MPHAGPGRCGGRGRQGQSPPRAVPGAAERSGAALIDLLIGELGKSRSICVGVRACALRPPWRRMRSAR